MINGTNNAGAVQSGKYNFTNVMSNHTIIASFTIKTYLITVLSNDEKYGTVLGGGTYQSGQNVTLTAVPTEIGKFENWTKEGTIVSTENTYNFTATDDMAYTANFKEKVGINDFIELPRFNIYPNPVSDVLKIDHFCNDAAYKIFRIEIYNSYGTLAKAVDINDVKTEINVSSFVSGLYLIRFIENQSNSTMQFVKK